MAIKIVDKLCPQNHPCPAVHICPVEALSQKGTKAPVVNSNLCTDCGECTGFCPTGALQVKQD